jgi:hypothetical protein
MNPSRTGSEAPYRRRRRQWRFKPSRTTIAFVRTLEDFCGVVLSAGSLQETRWGSEWYVGNLQNAPGKSCHVNLATGEYHDFTTDEGGGPRKLFASIFGIDPKDRETIEAGMTAWIEKGELPDGNDLGEPPERIIRPKPRRIVSRPTNSAVEAAKWAAIVADNLTHLPDIAALLAAYRGLSVGTFEWLVREGYIALWEGPWYSKKRRTEFEDTRIVFPACREMEDGVDFYGIHARWAVVATRGATNIQNLLPAFEAISPSAHITLLRQNDSADGLFLKALPEEIRNRARHIIPPDGDTDYAKDLNEWLARDGPEAVRRVLASRASYS